MRCDGPVKEQTRGCVQRPTVVDGGSLACDKRMSRHTIKAKNESANEITRQIGDIVPRTDSAFAIDYAVRILRDHLDASCFSPDRVDRNIWETYRCRASRTKLTLR